MSQLNAKVPMRRSSIEMDIAVLQVLSGSKLLKLTHIMYKTNMNASILKQKLIALEGKGLIRCVKLHKQHLTHQGKDRAFYRSTAKGMEVLHSYLSAYNALGSFEDER